MPAMAREDESTGPHFLVVTYPAQGHINPARHLAQRLLRATPGARVTLSTAVSACRKMFPEAASAADSELVDGAGIRYAPYSDGYGEEGFDRAKDDHTAYMGQLKLVGAQTLDALLARFRNEGRPVTRVVYTVLLSWVADVARGHGVPAALYWIQPATVLAAYFHYFRGTDGVDAAIVAKAADPWAEVRLPGITAQLRVRDLPSFLVSGSGAATEGGNDSYAFVLAEFREQLAALDREDDPTVLVNTFDAMEPDAVATLREHGLDVVPVGPLLSFLDSAGPGAEPAPSNNNDLFKQDGKGYMAWLDAQPAASVVYISFGSMSVMSERQVAEVARGMADSGRPFLWVLRKDNRAGADAGAGIDVGDGNGMVVEWCEQEKVLGHAAVGCFVTHCGWNSTVESVACGVPAVGVPQWTDQGTNAWLLDRIGVGVRAAVSEDDGVLEAEELQRCLAFAASEPVRAQAALWRDKARAAAARGGSSERNLRAFVEQAIGTGNN